jgi:hypothetical protein
VVTIIKYNGHVVTIPKDNSHVVEEPKDKSHIHCIWSLVNNQITENILQLVYTAYIQ